MDDETLVDRVIDAFFDADDADGLQAFYVAKDAFDVLKAKCLAATPPIEPPLVIRELEISERKRKTKRAPKRAAIERIENELLRADQTLSIFFYLKEHHPGLETHVHHAAMFMEGAFPGDWATFEAKLPEACAKFAAVNQRAAGTAADSDWMFSYLADSKRREKELKPEDYEDVDDGPIDLPTNSRLFGVVSVVREKPEPLLVELPNGEISFSEAETGNGEVVRNRILEAIGELLLKKELPQLEPSCRKLPESRDAYSLVKFAREALDLLIENHKQIDSTVEYRDQLTKSRDYMKDVCIKVADWRIMQAQRNIAAADLEFAESVELLTPSAATAKIADWDKVTRIAAGVALPDWDGAKHSLFLFSAHLKRAPEDTSAWPSVAAAAEQLNISRQAVYDAAKETNGRPAKLRIVDGKVDPKTLLNYRPAKKNGRSGKNPAGGNVGPLKEWECGNCGQSCEPAARKPKKCKTCPSTDIREVLDQ